MPATRLSLIGVIVLVGVLSHPITACAKQTVHWGDNTVSIVYLSKEEFLVGEPISLKIELFNLHSKPIRVRDMRGQYFNYFHFTGEDSFGKPLEDVTPTQISVWSGFVPISPGADFNDVVFLNEYLHFPAAGIYSVAYRGSLQLRKEPPLVADANEQIIPLSGIVNVKLKKGSPDELEKALRVHLKPLRSTNYRLAERAARALIVSEHELAVRLLKEALNVDEATPVSSKDVAWALARIHSEQAIQALREIAADPNSRARVEAISELGRHHIKEGMPTLMSVLSDENARVRVATLRALGMMMDKSSIPDIESRLADPDEKVREAAEKALKALTQGRGENGQPEK